MCFRNRVAILDDFQMIHLLTILYKFSRHYFKLWSEKLQFYQQYRLPRLLKEKTSFEDMYFKNTRHNTKVFKDKLKDCDLFS